MAQRTTCLFFFGLFRWQSVGRVERCLLFSEHWDTFVNELMILKEHCAYNPLLISSDGNHRNYGAVTFLWSIPLKEKSWRLGHFLVRPVLRRVWSVNITCENWQNFQKLVGSESQRRQSWKQTSLQKQHRKLAPEKIFLCNFLAGSRHRVHVCFAFLATPLPSRIYPNFLSVTIGTENQPSEA